MSTTSGGVMTTDTQQRIFAVLRQVIAVLGIVFGILTQSVSALHLPIAASTWLGVGGAVILAIEHYVADPSTGSTPPKAP